jgi:hypothetical protein
MVLNGVSGRDTANYAQIKRQFYSLKLQGAIRQWVASPRAVTVGTIISTGGTLDGTLHSCNVSCGVVTRRPIGGYTQF